jgi:virginiamycin B lyase
MQIDSFVRRLVCGAAVAAVTLTAGTRARVDAQGSAALTGVVTSQAEGKMEGVLVTARRDGAKFDVTVVSDAQGKYSFPRTHLEPGTYALKIRAVGYDLATPGSVEVPAGKTATLNLSLEPAKDLSTQITSVEWLMSLPGTDEQKAMVQRQILSCTYCHSLERIVKSKHTP